jgi:hypothetical protein
MENILKEKFESGLKFAIKEGWNKGLEDKIELFKNISTTNAEIIKTSMGYAIEWSVYVSEEETLVLEVSFNQQEEIFNAIFYTE